MANSENEINKNEYYQSVRALFENTNPPLAHVHTFGCQQNVADGEHIKGMLAQMGFGFTDSLDNADLVLYNTCAVRENAEDRVFGNVGALKHHKRRNPDMLIALCGCMVQQEHITQRLRKSFPHVDLIFGTHMLGQFPKLIYQALTKRERVFAIPDKAGEISEGLPVQRESSFKASVSIMYGCNNFCTYCIVPYVRGRERSRAAQAVVDEVSSLVDEGYKEILLLGQNVNSYRDEDTDFPALLQRLNAIDGEFRITFMTSHPKDCTPALIDTIAESEKVSRHLHLPVQCGSDRILSLMNRKYTREQYLALIAYAKERIPEMLFTSDIIVGFPGEQHEDFLQTLSLIREVGYSGLYTFIYSKREGTKAAQMEDIVPYEDKNAWFREMLDVQREIMEQLLQGYVGKTLRVLADGVGRSDASLISGKSDEGLIVDFPGDKELIGSFLHINVTKALGWALVGQIIQD